MSASIAFLADLVLLAHSLVAILLRGVLMLHKLPPLDVSVHLVQTASLDRTLLLHALLQPLLSVVLSEVLRVTVQRARKVRRSRIWMVQLGVVDEFMENSDVLRHLSLILDVFSGSLGPQPQLTKQSKVKVWILPRN